MDKIIRAEKSLIEKLKHKKIKIDYDYETLRNNYQIQYYKEEKTLNIFDAFIKRDLKGKVPLHSYISSTFSTTEFLNDIFDDVKKFYFFKSTTSNLSKPNTRLSFSTVFLYKNILFSMGLNQIGVLYNDSSEFYKNYDFFESICQKYSLENNNNGKIKIVMKDASGFYLKDFNVDKTDLDVNLNYNDNFSEVDKNIKNKLAITTKGIVILHGEKGSGKTNYIRHLIYSLNKRFIFLPSYLCASIGETNFITFLINNCVDSIIIMEDAEDYLKSRENAC